VTALDVVSVAAVCSALLSAFRSRDRCPMWLWSLLCWFPVVLSWNPHSRDWQTFVWAPLACLSCVLLGASVIEASGELLREVPSISVLLAIGLGFLSMSVAHIGWVGPWNDSILVAVVASVRAVRIWAAVYGMLMLAFWVSVPIRGRWRLPAVRHLLVVVATAVTFAAAGLLVGPKRTNTQWANADEILRLLRAVILISYSARDASQSLSHGWTRVAVLFRGGLGALRSCLSLRTTS